MTVELKPGKVVRLRERLWRIDQVDDVEFAATPLDGRDTFQRKFLRALSRFRDNKVVEEEGWVEVEGRKLREGYFAARVVGPSMEPLIPDGSVCLFRSPVEGSREGKILIVHLPGAEDLGGSGAYTVKRYHSEKETFSDGTWRHTKIELRPENNQFEPLLLDLEEDPVVVAEFVEVIGSDAGV